MAINASVDSMHQMYLMADTYIGSHILQMRRTIKDRVHVRKSLVISFPFTLELDPKKGSHLQVLSLVDNPFRMI